MNFVVGGYPDIDNKLKNEIRLLKVASLYGDKTILISPLYQFYEAITIDYKHKFLEMAIISSIKKLLPACILADPSIEDKVNTILELEKIVASKRYRQKGHFKEKMKIRNLLKNFHKEMIEVLELYLGKENIDTVKMLESENKLMVESFSSKVITDDEFIVEYLQKVDKSLSSAYPLLDKRLGELVEQVRKHQKESFSPVEKKNLGFAGLANSFVMELPAFDVASVNEIIDIRKELDKSLVRFRAAVMTFSKEIEAYPWDKDFNMNCKNIFIEHVEPAVLQIKEKIRDNNIFKNLVSSTLASQDFKSLLGSICISVLGYYGAESISSSINKGLVMGGTLLSTEITKAVYRTNQMSNKIKKHDLYFYYEASNRFK